MNEGRMAENQTKPVEVLIADDLIVNIYFIKHNLENLGYKVDFATNGDMLVERAKITLPDVILLDAGIPVIAWNDAAAKLKENETTAAIPIILMVDNIRKFDKLAAFKSGISDIIKKPFILDDVITRIDINVTQNKLRNGNSGVAEYSYKTNQPEPASEKPLPIQSEKKMISISGVNLSGEYLSQISHEIRTPLNAIINFTQLLEEELNPEVADDLNVVFSSIKMAGERLTRTIDIILNLAEVQSGNFNFTAVEFDIMDICEAINTDYETKAHNKQLDFKIIKLTENTKLIADQFSIWHILKNLVDNAIKFTSEGKVEVSIFRDAEAKLVVEVADTGIGIAKEFIPNLFEPFSKLGQAYPVKYEGNGIGLALTRKYCILNKADIEVESRKGYGSVFRIIFTQS